ncbi:hypothetical protein DPMN_160195 [Dreissena polymorpha]|uniref:Uncharacterized protein n=1 Tax=Dreissena polymorpha TaxID=45954 RepID=A0A9D4EQR1_DREPO|nr:hypothetical protein DPMN_160195 [Dreissena polymorpha]
MFFRKPNMSGPCGAQRCATCPYMMTADYFTDPSGRKYSVRNNVDCKSSNVVYAVNCRRCRKYVCVGERRNSVPATSVESVAYSHTAVTR